MANRHGGNPPRTPKGVKTGGRQKGTKNKSTVEKELLGERARQQVEAAQRQGIPLAKEILEKFMLVFAGIATIYQPLPANAEQTMSAEEIAKRTPNEDKFEKWGSLAIRCAEKLAPFQSPTFKAIMVAPPPPAPSGERRRFTLTIFESGPKPRMLTVTDPGKNGRDDAAA